MKTEDFERFYAESFRRLVGQLAAMTGNQAEAQDAVQEAFVRAWERRGRIDADAPEAWIRVTAWRIAVSRWRRARTGERLLRLIGRPDAADGPAPEPVMFADALARLPAEQRRALVLFYLCDLTVAQIAAESGAPPGTVKARLARGRAALAAHLADRDPSDAPATDEVVHGA